MTKIALLFALMNGIGLPTIQQHNTIIDYSLLAMDGANSIEGKINIYHDIVYMETLRGELVLDFTIDVNMTYYYDFINDRITSCEVWANLTNNDMEETMLYSVELNVNQLNNKQYYDIYTTLAWFDGLFDTQNYIVHVEDLNQDEAETLTWEDHYNTTATLDLDFISQTDVGYLMNYNIWYFDELYREINTIKSLVNQDNILLYQQAYNDGYNGGYDVGYDVGYGANVEKVATEKYQEGYNKGYADGYASNLEPITFDQVLTAIITAPSKIIKEGFDFDILGINVGGLIQTALVIGLVVFAIGTFKKG